MNTLKENLLSLGLTEDEITVYLATLQPDNETILKISQNTTIPRTTVYLLIESLKEKGFLSEVVEGKKRFYKPAKPEKIIDYAAKKREEFSHVIANLEKNIYVIQALYNIHFEKPKVSYYEGKKSVSDLLSTILGDEEVCMQFLSDDGRKYFSDGIEGFRNEVQEKLVPSREIVSSCMTDVHYAQMKANRRNQIRILQKEYGLSVDFILYSQGIIYITYVQNTPMATRIHDRKIAHFEKIRFNMLWEHPALQENNK